MCPQLGEIFFPEQSQGMEDFVGPSSCLVYSSSSSELINRLRDLLFSLKVLSSEDASMVVSKIIKRGDLNSSKI